MTNAFSLPAFSDAIAAAVAAAGPSVVRVVSGRRLGSGVAWAERHIVTVASAVGRNGSARVTFADGSEHDARLVGADPATDLAVLETDAPLVVGPRIDGADLKVGHLVLVLGRPGQSVRASLGIVSSHANTPWTSPLGGGVSRFIEVDATLPGGFGGGPLIDSTGRIVGVNSRSLVRGGTTLPSDTVDAVVTKILAQGSIVRGWIGVMFQAVDLGAEGAETGSQTRGLLVTGVAPASPAARAGVRLGDILLRLGDAPLGSWEELAGALAGVVDSDQPLDLLRGGAATRITVRPVARPRRAHC